MWHDFRFSNQFFRTIKSTYGKVAVDIFLWIHDDVNFLIIIHDILTTYLFWIVYFGVKMWYVLVFSV